MMEALDQQQTKLTSNRDAGEAGTGAGSGSEAGAGAGAACGEEDDFEEPHHALGLAKEKEDAGDNNNDAAAAVPAEKKGDGKRKKSADDVIDLTLANGQGSSDRQESRDGTEASVMEEAEAAKESSLDLGEDTATSPGEASTESVKQEQVDDSQDELPEPRSLPEVNVEAEVTPPPVIDLETDSENEAEEEFLSFKDSKSPVPESEEDSEQDAEESQPSNALYKDPVGEDVSAADQAMEAVQEKTPQPTRDFLMEESDTVDSPSLTMDLDHVDFPSSENGEATMGAIKIESESDEEHLGKSKGIAPAADDLVPPIKLNGAHQSAKVEQKDEEETQDAELFQQEIKEPQQLSVIPNHTGTNDHAEPTAAPPLEPSLSLVLPIRRSRSRTTSCGSSTISSASQPQLVIDHPESEQNARVPTLNLSMKRRRSKSSSVSQPDQQQPKDESNGSSSLLLQRLQGNPNVGPSVAPQFLNCAKCNLQFEFESFQLLNEHQAQCRGPASRVSASTHALRSKKERFFRCKQCRKVFQCWNFFIHMREVHQMYYCTYCSHVYPSTEKLSLHLENKHDYDQRHIAKEEWALLRETKDRAQHLICCTCQATFAEGTDFDSHDCSQLMQPCTLCGQKGAHAAGCRNNKRKPAKRRRKMRKPPDPPAPPLVQELVAQPPPVEMQPVMEQQLQFQPEPQPFYPAENIPAPEPVEEPPAPPSPKLVVPKIMLRVPKEFQKSVDAALSSTDTEDEEMDVTQPAEETAPAGPPEDMAPMEKAPPEDLPTEAAPSPPLGPPPPALSFDESPTAKLSRVLAELERTKLDIERTKADIITKKQAKVIMAQAEVENVIAQAADGRLQQQQQQQQPQPDEQRRWSLTPPASPHNHNHHNHMNLPEPPPAVITEFQARPDAERRNSLGSDCMDIDDSLNGPDYEDGREQPEEKSQESLVRPETMQEGQERELLPIQQPLPPPAPPADGIPVAGAETQTVDLQLDRPLDRFSMVDFVRLCLKSVYSACLYCNHARRIAVNGKQLVLHLIGQHRFTATVDSITAEELYAETIVAKLKSFLPHLEQEYLNSASCCSVDDGMYAEHFNERIYECFTCRFVTSTHKELYTHNRRLHPKSNITCVMCQMNFYSYSEILCHICPGEMGGSIYDLKFRCCLCEVAPMPSAFRLMVHLRKQHQACDICLEDCQSQSKLSAHVWKHKLLHLCYRCGIAYRNKQDISKHLFWKHGTESASCKRCLQKRWRHVYHFCVPPVQFPCEQCGFNFSKAIYLEVHQRMHSGDFRYACAEEGCEEKFVSRKLLLNHASSHVVKELPQEALMSPKDEDSIPKSEELIKKESAEGEETQDGKPSEDKHLADGETKQTDQKKDSENNKESVKEQSDNKSENRKRRKKSKRSKESLEDLNLIAPNLSESDSSDDSDSDAPRSSHREQPAALPMRSSVDDLDMPKVMLSPSSESDADDAMEGKPKLEDKEKPAAQKEEKNEQDDTKLEEEGDSKKENEEEMDVSIWKNLLQNQAINPEADPAAVKEEVIAPETRHQPPAKLHVAWSDHDYCKLHRTPPPSPVKQKSTPKSASKRPGAANASSDSDTSSCSSSSDSDSSSCSCGTNCSCSSSNSSSSSDDSDDSDSSNTAAGSPQKRVRKKSLKHNNKKGAESLTRTEPNERTQEDVDINVTALNEENPAPPPSPQPPMYNESDFDTAFSETDEEFYDPHPQKLANELLTQKREALLAEHAPLGPSNNYDIVENSRPSTPSLPEEAQAYADKRERVRNKKKKRERKSTCKSGKMPPMVASMPLPMDGMPGVSAMSGMVAPLEPPTPMPAHQQESPLFPVTPLTHRHLQPSLTPMSEGSSCSDADGQLKRSKRQRRPNKFYGYTSDDENMSTILAPPLQVGMQLIKPQPPPQLTWAKEDLPTPPKQRSRNNNNSSHHHSHSHSNGGTGLAGSSRKRSKQRSLLGAGGSRPAKRHKPDREDHLPPIPTLKIRPSLLPTAPPTDSSDSSSDDEDVEVNVTCLVATPQPAPPSVGLPPPPAVALPVQPPPPPPPAATAFNQPIPPALLPNPGFATLQYFKANNIRYPIRPPAGARLAREGESVYCYCRCPYDEVSEMIACDGDNCLIEWFHFECVGIMVAPQGKWFCAECRPKYSEGVYQGQAKP